MNFYAVSFLTCTVSTLGIADSLNTSSNDYYMTPPSSYSTVSTPYESPSPQENCWYEQVPLQTQENEHAIDGRGAVVGGIIGGIVGHQFGSGSGNTAATVGGAVIGATLGGSPSPSPQRYQTVRKCNTVK